MVDTAQESASSVHPKYGCMQAKHVSIWAHAEPVGLARRGHAQAHYLRVRDDRRGYSPPATTRPVRRTRRSPDELAPARARARRTSREERRTTTPFERTKR